MVTTPNGPGGLTAVRPVEEVPKHDPEIAPIPLHRTVEETAMGWEPPIRHKNATQILAVSFQCKEMENWCGWHLKLELESHFTILDLL